MTSKLSASVEETLVDRPRRSGLVAAKRLSIARRFTVRRRDVCLDIWPTGGEWVEEVKGLTGEEATSGRVRLGINDESRNIIRRAAILSAHTMTVRLGTSSLEFVFF